MPEQHNKPRWRLTDELWGKRLWQVIEQKTAIEIGCYNCHHQTCWTADFMDKRFGRRRIVSRRMEEIVDRLRCSKCRSPFVRVNSAVKH